MMLVCQLGHLIVGCNELRPGELRGPWSLRTQGKSEPGDLDLCTAFVVVQ